MSSAKLYVGNLSYDTSEAGLRTLFETHGDVVSVALITDRETGRPRGFAFVEMTEKRDAETAISQLNGAEINGRALNVNEARPKPTGGSGFGGGRGAGGGGGGRGRGGSGGSGGGGGGRGSRW